MNKDLLEYLKQFITPEKVQLFQRILENRTRYLTIVLEEIFQPQNASAVIRTADCFGIQDIHAIENRNEFAVDKEVAMGASKWLSLYRYQEEGGNSLAAIRKLKSNGYRIVATSPHISDVFLHDFDLTKGKTALVFGTELGGITDIIKNEADEFLQIPMYGFTESFNISVSAAITMHHLTHRLRNETTIDWHLTEEEKVDIMLNWIRQTLKRADLIEKKFYELHGK